ncbi:hypothetical protein PanWU01x14_077020 [Parasponia andersonii]|uniref:Uncharacterized protein n=1 Tax=Parasponia andersonii TaxID=3476 RepID=A0A2P5DCI2_PARAD|nr:hypothetical protein PanWU01x14_077020 [Parasponia andersonii]
MQNGRFRLITATYGPWLHGALCSGHGKIPSHSDGNMMGSSLRVPSPHAATQSPLHGQPGIIGGVVDQESGTTPERIAYVNVIGDVVVDDVEREYSSGIGLGSGKPTHGVYHENSYGSMDLRIMTKDC